MKLHKAQIEEFKKLCVLVIGDVMLDQYIWGKVDRISPEAPIPIVSVLHREERLGGAANVALNLKTLGANPIIASVIGQDIKGVRFKELCQENNINTSGILETSKRPTTTKTRVIGHSQHLLRVDEETDMPLQAEDENLFMQKILKIIEQNKVDAIVFEDYDKGAITANIINFVSQLAKISNIPIAVDPKHRNFLHYKNCNLFKPNLKELSIGLKSDIDKKNLIPQVGEMCKKFMNTQGHKIMMVTLSEQGIFIINENEQHHIPTQVRDLADVSGAGDTVISTATLCLAIGLPLYDIAYISNVAAGIVCEKVGVVPIHKNELIQRLA